MARAMRISNSEEKIPVPDPTVLTTAQLMHEITLLKEYFEIQLDATAKALVVVEENANKIPTIIDREVAHLKELQSEKFAGIDMRFTERDRWILQSDTDSKAAVNTALNAAKEAVREQNINATASATKTEANFTKQIEGMVLSIAASTKGTDGKIDDIKGTLAELRLAMADKITISQHDTLQQQVNTLQLASGNTTSKSEGKSEGINSLIAIAISVISVLLWAATVVIMLVKK